jgi:23S rRNA (pseudouridine1915-N3)-methyltransferase
MPRNTTLLQAQDRLRIYDFRFMIEEPLSNFIRIRLLSKEPMFKLKIIALGKLKEKAYQELEAEFLKRLSPFAKIKVVELPEVPYRRNDVLEKVKEREAEKIVKVLPQGAVVVLLMEKGANRDSKNFATYLERLGQLNKEIIFVIGSGLGLHSSLQRYGNYSLSLSPMTFPHNMARIILEEQIYRACMILSGRDYHK